MDKTNHIKSLLLQWFHENKRNLPWRVDNDPYKIWLSEIILQQTRVNQGLPYYLKFLNKYPTISHLAKASEDEVLKIWQGLGYYSRARNLHRTAKFITDNHAGIFPNEYDQILNLKGVGEYTAAAIASICFNIPKPVIDGNVFRVLSRIYGITEPIDTARGKNIFKVYASELLDKNQAGEFNQAIMEFGALQCLPQKPNCFDCDLKKYCDAYHNNTTDQLPVKKNKVLQKLVWHYYFIYTDGERLLIEKRPETGIWNGLYQFPLIELDYALSSEQIQDLRLWKLLSKDVFATKIIQKREKHLLTHRKISATYIVFYSKHKIINTIEKYQLAETKELFKLPVSKMMESFLTLHYETIIEIPSI